MLGTSTFGSTPFGGSDDSQQTNFYDEIATYFPLEIINPVENNYFQLHLKAFVDNQYSNNDYAIMAIHQIFMFVLYGLISGCLKRSETLRKKVFALSPRDPKVRKQLKEITSLFTLSLLGESEVVNILDALGCDRLTDAGKLKSLVRTRNDLAHCNGRYCINFPHDMKQYIDGLEVLHKMMAPVTGLHLLDINDIDFEAEEDVQKDEHIRILSNSYVSLRMLELVKVNIIVGKLNKEGRKLLMSYLNG